MIGCTCICLLAACGGGDKPADGRQAKDREALQEYMRQYPQSQLCDVYKFCFQDVFGPEHLVGDSSAMAQYILRELDYADSSDWERPAFAYPVGLEGNFLRVDLNYVRQGLVPAGTLAKAFVMSAEGWMDGSAPSLEAWREQWNGIMATLRTVQPQPQRFEEDSAAIADALDRGEYAFHHSQLFNSTYHQHYRIIRRDVFDSLIAPLLGGF